MRPRKDRGVSESRQQAIFYLRRKYAKKRVSRYLTTDVTQRGNRRSTTADSRATGQGIATLAEQPELSHKKSELKAASRSNTFHHSTHSPLHSAMPQPQMMRDRSIGKSITHEAKNRQVGLVDARLKRHEPPHLP